MLLPFGIDLFGTFSAGLEWVVRVLLSGIINALGMIFGIGIESYLFFENPIGLAPLEPVWQASFVLFAVVLGLGLLQHVFVLEIHPYNRDIEIQRLIERGTIAAIVVLLSRPFLAFVVSVVHALSGAYYHTPFSLNWGVDILARIMAATDIWLSVPLGLFTTFLIAVFGLGLLFMFVVRMFAVYVLYALFPLLMGLWIFDVGPIDQVREFTNKGFQMTAYLLLYGPIGTAFIWIGSLLGNFSEGGTSGGTFTSATVSTEAGVHLSSHAGDLAAALGDLFTFLSTIGAVMLFGLFGFIKVLK